MSQSTVTVTVAPLEAVRLTAPVDGAQYAPGTVIALTAVAPTGSTVEFLCNGAVVGTKTAPYSLPVKLSAGVKAFAVRLKAAVVPPPVIVPPAPTVASPDDTYGSTITDAAGGAWTLGAGGETLRNGVHVGGGRAEAYLWLGGVIYVVNSIEQWFRWSGSAWVYFSPATEAADVRPFSRGHRGPVPKPPVAASDLADKPLVQQNTLTWLGAFFGPEWNPGADGGTIGYGGHGMAYNPANNSLFVTANINQWPPRVAEMSIPSTINTTLATMTQSVYLQDYNQDIFDAQVYGDHPGDLLVHNGRLILNSRVYYDANASQNAFGKAHYYRPSLNLVTTGVTVGPLRVTSVKQNYISGYMNPVPDYAQSALGGPAFTGWSCGPSIVGRTSAGPAVATFNPDQLGVTDPVPGTDLVYYDDETTATLGHWGTQPNVWPRVAGVGEDHRYNGTAEIWGVAMPHNSRSVLFFGSIGYGSFCYGHKFTDIAKIGTDEPDGQHNCLLVEPVDYTSQLSYYSIDPANDCRSAPFHYQIWAYDALDLAQVKLGNLDPWEVEPYAYWTLDTVSAETLGAGTLADNAKVAPRAVAHDPSTDRMYMYQQRGEFPLIHVFTHTP